MSEGWTLRTYCMEASKTNIYKPEHMEKCLQFELISEIGEVADKIKKSYRDGYSFDEATFVEGLAQELGDCCWAMSQLQEDLWMTRLDQWVDIPIKLDLEAFEHCILMFARTLATGYLFEACNRLGFSLDEIMDKNIQKLRSRAERGVIQGSGDDR